MKAELIDVFGNDRMVADSARVSFASTAEDYSDERVAKLIRFLAREGHVNPFFHPQARFRLTAPIFVARQWFRSTVGVARSEVSRRYVDTEPEFFVPDQWRARPDKSIKQGSGEPCYDQHYPSAIYAEAMIHAKLAYRRLLEHGVAPEQARMVLPQSMYTSWIESGSLFY